MRTAEQCEAEARAKLDAATVLANAASSENRSLTKAERSQIEGLLEDVSSLKSERDLARELEDRVALTADIDAMNAKLRPGGIDDSLGDQLVKAGLLRTPEPERLSVKGGREAILPVFGFKAPTSPAVTDLAPRGAASIERLGADQRWLYPAIPQQDLGTDLSIRDFRHTVRTVTGTVERDPTAVTGKATLATTVTAVNTAVKQEAIILDAIPNAVLESMAGFRAFAEAELRFQIAKALDSHVFSSLNTGATFGTSGTGLIAILRNGITAMAADGFTPDVAVLNATDAATLDLTQDTAGSYVFALRDTGDSSPLWGLRIVVRTSAAGNEPPLLVDTSRAGVLYLGVMRVDLDPFAGVSGSNFENNTTDIRAEVNCLMHVRNAKAARRLAAT